MQNNAKLSATSRLQNQDNLHHSLFSIRDQRAEFDHDNQRITLAFWHTEVGLLDQVAHL